MSQGEVDKGAILYWTSKRLSAQACNTHAPNEQHLMIFLPNLPQPTCVIERPTPRRQSRGPSCLEAQRVLRVMLARPRRILGRVADAGGGVGDGVAGAFGRVADGARHALGRVADGVAHTTDYREVVSDLTWEERERERGRRSKVGNGERRPVAYRHCPQCQSRHRRSCLLCRSRRRQRLFFRLN